MEHTQGTAEKIKQKILALQPGETLDTRVIFSRKTAHSLSTRRLKHSASYACHRISYTTVFSKPAVGNCTGFSSQTRQSQERWHVFDLCGTLQGGRLNGVLQSETKGRSSGGKLGTKNKAWITMHIKYL